MSTERSTDCEVAVIGAGVVGCAVALALARRGAAVTVMEAEPEPALGASGANSGILHTGFDSPPGELETQLILRSAELREAALATLGVPVVRCGAVMHVRDRTEREAISALQAGARANGVEAVERAEGALEIPGEAVTDPVAYTRALAQSAQLHNAQVLTSFRVCAIEWTSPGTLLIRSEDSAAVSARAVVNCAGLHADAVARMMGDDSFEIYPRKGEFLVFDQPAGSQLDRILLPVPTERTKGVLVFPTVDGKVIAGPTALDREDKNDRLVRAEARDEILPKATAMYPPLEDVEPIAAYAGLRPAGRGVNYVVGVSAGCPRLVNVAAIRSTGLSASLGIAERVCSIVASVGVGLGPERELLAGQLETPQEPWWRRAAGGRAR
ncbi:MAG: FAD-dependent oxidoreductase [Actinobacteria bacterium]|nr:MAG: FAD-dependent oxidoreductase [Actinomycetota bacterium]